MDEGKEMVNVTPTLDGAAAGEQLHLRVYDRAGRRDLSFFFTSKLQPGYITNNTSDFPFAKKILARPTIPATNPFLIKPSTSKIIGLMAGGTFGGQADPSTNIFDSPNKSLVASQSSGTVENGSSGKVQERKGFFGATMDRCKSNEGPEGMINEGGSRELMGEYLRVSLLRIVAIDEVSFDDIIPDISQSEYQRRSFSKHGELCQRSSRL